MTFDTDHAVQTHVGLTRKVNEDAVLALPALGIWVVSDGMGGHAAGDFASQQITEKVAKIPVETPPQARANAVREAILEAHRMIRAEADTRGLDVIGATVVALVLTGQEFTAIWAGDSRLYRLRAGKIEMITTDHSFVAALVQAGQMTWDEAEEHPQANAILRAVGVGDVPELDEVRGTVDTGDRFLLCSDGLTKYATFEILRHALATQPLGLVCDHLTQLALDGGGRDNITAAVIDVV